MGHRDARREMQRKQPSPLDPSATQMREPGVGMSFRESMAGRFMLGVTDPKDPRLETSAANELAMHAAIHIDDIVEFVADPQHLAELTGHIDFTPFGTSLPAESGVFGLFTPSDDPALTYMVYELGFRYAGKSYYLAGKKHVRIGAPWKLWRETTTLYTRLHESVDATGPVVGAGVLRLGAFDLLRLLGTVHATNAPTSWRAAGVVWRFFCFFVAELLRTYLPRRRR